MGFYELGNGCDSCDIIPQSPNVNLAAGAYTQTTPYGAQANTVQQYNNAISSGYVTSGTNFGGMGTGSSGSTLGSGQYYQQPTQQVVVQTVPAQPKVVKQVVTTTTTTPVANAPIVKKQNKVEGFTDGTTDNLMSNDKNWIVLGLVLFSAMSLNECCKYFLNKSLQLNDGSPFYYVAYVMVAIMLTVAANKYSSM